MNVQLDEIVAHYIDQLDQYLGGWDYTVERLGQPPIDIMTGQEAWVTRAVLRLCLELRQVAFLAAELGEVDTAVRIDSTLHDMVGRCGSPEELVWFLSALDQVQPR